MKGLTKKEEDVAKEIISAGLVKAAESLTFFMNETITLKDFEEDIAATPEKETDTSSEKEKQEEKNENIYENIDEMLSSTLSTNEDK